MKIRKLRKDLVFYSRIIPRLISGVCSRIISRSINEVFAGRANITAR